jgi:2-polyprenyl-6-methoxyphenol hydroxylase-like FAD-dependent oxidoreductase
MSNVTIIGAGPAGALAAILLARGGWDVTLVEQHRFPRDKVCGECLSATGIAVLARMGLRDTLRALGPVELQRSVLVAGDGGEVSMNLRRAMWGLSRRAMDDALLRAAIVAGARLAQPMRCERIETTPLRVTLRDLTTNRLSVAKPDLGLLADGKGASVKPTGDLGLKAHFIGVADDPHTISLFALDGHYVGLAPIEADRWNVAMSVPGAKVKRFAGDLESLFEQILRENAGLARRMRGARRVSEWLASPLPRFPVQNDWPDGVIPIGNAAAALEPIGGEGMGLALRSAEVVAEELLAAGANYDAAKLRRRMRRLWNVRSMTCRAGGVMLSRPRAARFITRVGKPLAPLALRLAGK